MKELEKQLGILVIEDSPEFLAIAKKVYDADTRLKPSYASTYNQAMNLLDKAKIEGVVSDLFFASEVDHRVEVFNAIKKGLSKYEELNKEKLEQEYSGGTGQELMNIGLERFMTLDENPSGLGIVLNCSNQGIPYIIVSQGDRHKGNLNVVRNILKYHEIFSLNFQDDDPIGRMFVNGGSQVDKSNPKIWQDAVHGKYGLIERQTWKF